MEERKEEGEAEIQEHGPEHWFSKWERQCLAEAEQDEQLPPELQEEAAAAAQPEHKQQKLWHLFQNSATAVAQLYKGEGRRRRHLAPPRGWPAVGGGTSPGSGAPAVAPRPRRPLPARWRRGRRALGRGSGRGGAAGAGLGGAPALGPLPRRGSGKRVPCPLLRLGRRRPPSPGPGRAREEPPVTKWRREEAPGPYCAAAGLGAGTAWGRLPPPRLGPGLRPPRPPP